MALKYISMVENRHKIARDSNTAFFAELQKKDIKFILVSSFPFSSISPFINLVCCILTFDVVYIINFIIK